jgi:hypothetical protein
VSAGSLIRRVVGAALVLACLGAVGAGPAARAALGATRPARVQGRFTMRTVITTAVNVHGEHRGERLTRTWRILPSRCRRDVCRVLHLRRTRGLGRRLGLTLHRRRNGTYVGRGVFFVALSCRGRLHRRGARAPYTIRLRVTATRTVGGIRFARRLEANYVNHTRIDSTPCLLEPSHDAARYSGSSRGPLPSPPRVSFTPLVGANGLVSFTDTTRKGEGPGHRVRAWRWSFGDPASGAANQSRAAAPSHQFTGPGTYLVRLTATDHAGLRATARERVVVPAEVPAALRVLSAPG